jgi:hypothetical protein
VSIVSDLERNLEYLAENFVSLERLAENAGVTPDRVLELVHARCVPRHSYELKRTVVISSFVSGDTPVLEGAVRRFYAPALAHWIRVAEAPAARLPLDAVAARMRATFRADYRRALLELDRHGAELMECCTPEGTLDEGRFATAFDEVWTHWLEGTYGLCVRSPLSAKDVLRKELAVARLARLTLDGKKQIFTSDERAAVLRAVAEYDAAAMPFAPHDYPRSSRKRLVDDVWPRLFMDVLVAGRVAARGPGR